METYIIQTRHIGTTKISISFKRIKEYDTSEKMIFHRAQ